MNVISKSTVRVTAHSLYSMSLGRLFGVLGINVLTRPPVTHDARTMDELSKRLAIVYNSPVVITSASDPWRPLGMGDTTPPEKVYYTNVIPPLTMILLWSFYEVYVWFMRRYEPSIVGTHAVGDSKKRLEKMKEEYGLSDEYLLIPEVINTVSPELLIPKVDNSNDINNVYKDNKVIEKLKKNIQEHTVMVFLVGPKGIGKSVTLDALPRVLGIENAVHIGIDLERGAPGVIDQVYAHFRNIAVRNGYPSRPDGEEKIEYLKHVFAGLGGNKAVICLDYLASKEKKWTLEFSKQVRKLWEDGGVNVFATTSEGQCIIEAKVEPRRTVWTFPETPMESALRYIRCKYGKGGKDILPPEDYLTDKDLREYLEAVPRNYAELNVIDQIIEDVCNMYKYNKMTREAFREKWDAARKEFRQMRFVQGRKEVRGVMEKAKCRMNEFGDYELAETLLKKNSVTSQEIGIMCSGADGVNAQTILVSNNILRNVPVENRGRASDRQNFTFQYDYQRNAMEGMEATPSRKKKE